MNIIPGGEQVGGGGVQHIGGPGVQQVVPPPSGAQQPISFVDATRRALLAQETGEVFLYLLAMTHPDTTPMYFVNNTVAIVSSGITHEPFPFQITIPNDDDEFSRVQLSIDNIDRRVVDAVRSISSPATFTIRVIRAADPDVDLAGPFACALRNVSYDAHAVTGDLWPFEDVTNEPYPAHAMTPSLFPGLFG